MTTIWKKCIGLAFVSFSLTQAALALNPPTTTTTTFTVGETIPDGSVNGLSDTHTLDFTSQNLFSITDVQVTLDISGGFNGDYYGYLVHNNGFAILLNRVGRTSSDSVGYSDSGLNITLSAGSPNDIHDYQAVNNPGGGVLTGTWNVDGRNVDPATVLDTDARTALLGSFVGQDPSGDWTLFLADLDMGEQGQLVSWGLVITSVPEPGTVGLLALGLGGVVGMRRWLRRS